ncbi:MAG: hypothetical protein R2776_09855 [Flavobacteriaceae bacterium]
MKKLLLSFLVFAITSIGVEAQDFFEGVIHFSIEYTIIDSSSGVTEKMLNEIYGNKAEMYYSSNGDFKIKYSNSRNITTEADADYYFAGKNYLYATYTLESRIDSTNITHESSKLLSFEKQKNQRILSKDCDCYEYKAIDKYKEPANFTYCFSKESPSINAERYTNFKHFYLGDFFKISQKPYLKFSYEMDGYIMTFVASKLTEMEIGKEIFELD